MRRISVLRSLITVLIASMVFGTPVLAAQTSSASSAGISVVGYGQASAPADTATLQITVSSPNYGPPVAPQPDATPGAAERESVAPVVSALVDAGVSESEIEVIVPPYFGGSYGSYAGPAIALINVSLDDPSAQRIVELIDASTVGAAQERLLVGSAGVIYVINDCTALQRDAREAAINDAREQADIQAGLLDASLGDITASRDVISEPVSLFGIYGGSAGAESVGEMGCSSANTSNPYGYFDPFASSGFDPSAEPEVTVIATTELTFEMAADAEATPAS